MTLDALESGQEALRAKLQEFIEAGSPEHAEMFAGARTPGVGPSGHTINALFYMKCIEMPRFE